MVSVVIPTYNRADRLERAIRSCLEQTLGDIEVIVVDDGSDDGTGALVEGLAEREAPGRIRYFRQERGGACRARNLGIDQARGKYLQLLDSDDFLDRRKFEIQVAALDASGADVAVSAYLNLVEREGELVPDARVPNDGDLHVRIAEGYCPQIAPPLLRRTSLPTEVRFTPGLPRKQDMDFLFRYFLTVSRYVHQSEVLSYWVHHDRQRISDTYDEGTPVFEMFGAALEFWRGHREEIPRENWWMLRSNGLRSARRLLAARRDRDARRTALSALRVPAGARGAAGLLVVIAKSLLPATLRTRLRSALSRRPGSE